MAWVWPAVGVSILVGLTMYAFSASGTGTLKLLDKAFVFVVAAAMATYWSGQYRNWQQLKLDDPAAPSPMGAMIWHLIVLAAIATTIVDWQNWK